MVRQTHSMLTPIIDEALKTPSFRIKESTAITGNKTLADKIHNYRNHLKQNDIKSILFLAPANVESIAMAYAIFHSNRTFLPIHTTTSLSLALSIADDYQVDALTIQKRLLKQPIHQLLANFTGEIIDAEMFYILKLKPKKTFSLLPGMVFFTSGSTEKPKAVHYSYDVIAKYAGWITQLSAICDTDCFLFQSEFCFVASLRPFLSPLIAGCTIVTVDLLSKIDIVTLSQRIARDKVTILSLTPSLLKLLLSDGATSLSNAEVRQLQLSGEPINENAINKWKDSISQDTEIFSFYGMTETLVAFWLKLPQVTKIDKPLPLGELRPGLSLSLKEHDNELFTLCFSGEVANAYLTDTSGHGGFFIKENKRCFSGDDLIRIDAEKYYFTARKKQIIKHFGHRINLQQLKKIIELTEGVSEAEVIFTNTEPKQIIAFVVSKQSSSNKIITTLNEHLPQYAHPHHIEFLSEMPRNANGKTALLELSSMIKDSSHYSFMEIFRHYTNDGRLHRDSLYLSLNLSSLDNIEISQRLMKKYNAHIDVNDISPQTSLGDLQNHLKPLTKSTANETNKIPLSNILKQLYQYLAEDRSEARVCYIFHYRLQKKVNLKRLEKAIRNTINAHVMLRARLEISDKEVEYVLSQTDYKIWLRYPYFSPTLKFDKLVTYFTSPNLIRFHLYKKFNHTYLLVANSHLINDARTQFLTIEEIFKRYESPDYKSEIDEEDEIKMINQLINYEASTIDITERLRPTKGSSYHDVKIISPYDFNKGDAIRNQHFTLSKDCIAGFIDKYQLNDFSNSTIILMIYFLALSQYSQFEAVCFNFSLCTRNYPISSLHHLLYPCFTASHLIVPSIDNYVELAELIQHDTKLLSHYALNNKLHEYTNTAEGGFAANKEPLGVFTYMDQYKHEKMLINNYVDWERSSLYLQRSAKANHLSCLAFNLDSCFLYQFISTLGQPMLDGVSKNIFELVGEVPVVSRTAHAFS